MSREATHFLDELRGLNERVLSMGRLSEERVRLALQGLMGRNPNTLNDVIAGDGRLNAAQMDIDDRCFRMLALFHPVAVDLRTVVAALRINTDLERVGDLAVNIAEAAQRYVTYPPVKPLIDLPRMGDLALTMLRDALTSFVAMDTAVAYSVLRQDPWLDVLSKQIVRELLTYMLGNSRVIEPGVELILMSRHFERIGDHATNIAEDVIFLVQGRDVRHHSGHAPGAERRTRRDSPPV
jgi:phosphate transport system protein